MYNIYMKNILLILLLFSLYGCGEKTIDQRQLVYRGWVAYEVNQSEPFDGKAIEKYANGQNYYERNIKNGVLHGLVKKWYKNGQKRKEESYKNGMEHGKRVWWHENGQKEWEINYINGDEEGLSTKWHKNGNISKKEKFIKGKSQNKVEFYEGGEKYLEFNLLTGIETEWHKNGQKRTTSKIKNNKINGLVVKQSHSGTLISKIYYKNDKVDYSKPIVCNENDDMEINDNNFMDITAYGICATLSATQRLKNISK